LRIVLSRFLFRRSQPGSGQRARPWLLFLIAIAACHALAAAAAVREIAWGDIAPAVQRLLAQHGIDERNVRDRVAELRSRNRSRLIEGDRDHLVYYVLQSTAFTRLAPIEPASSAKAFISNGVIPQSAKARIDAFVSAIQSGRDLGARAELFREMIAREPIPRDGYARFLSEEYARAMRFLYEKEFAGGGPALYQTRGLSTDTSIDANYVVSLSLAVLRRLESDRQIRSVLIVGPGLDLAPRTGLIETGAPQSYQPFAVMDALLGTGLSARDALRMTVADINPRLSEWVSRARGKQPTLSLVSDITETPYVRLTDDYREYFTNVGRAIGAERPLRGVGAGRLGKSIVVAGGVTDGIDAATIDIAVERLDERYDLIVVTNVFPYLSDPELLLAISNIAAMLNPGGILIHNEPRPVLADALLALGVPLLQARSGVIATVKGEAPLYDAAWTHRVPLR
jgi:hypothetical protein